MAITATKKGNLAESKIEEKGSLVEEKDLKDNLESFSEKPSGPLKSTINVLKEVTWPSFGYVLRWSLVIVLFTAFFALSLGFFDHLFNNTVKYIDCTSLSGRAQRVNSCNSEFVKNITFR